MVNKKANMIYNAILSGSNNDFTHTFNQTIKDCIGYRINSVSVPISFYKVRSSNNKIDIIQSATTHNLALTVGDYSDASLIVELAVQLATINANFTVTLSGHYIVITHSTTGFTIDMDITDTADSVLGFATVTASATTQTATSSLNLYSTPNLIVTSDTLGTESLSNDYNNVLTILTINKTYGDVFVRTYEHPEVVTIAEKNIKEIHIKLYHQDGEEFTSNGLNITLNMTFYN